MIESSSEKRGSLSRSGNFHERFNKVVSKRLGLRLEYPEADALVGVEAQQQVAHFRHDARPVLVLDQERLEAGFVEGGAPAALVRGPDVRGDGGLHAGVLRVPAGVARVRQEDTCKKMNEVTNSMPIQTKFINVWSKHFTK